MKIGYPLFGLGPRSWAAVCEKADEVGFESIWMQEHLVFPTQIPPTYPYSETGVPPINPDTQLYDVWVSLAYIAARTSKIRLATNVFIIPLRDPIVTARAVTTLDRLSGGRLMIGGGVGWLKEEFDIAGQDWSTRGKRTDEIIEIWRKLWSEETIEHRGTHYEFQPIKFWPKSAQKPGIPIHIGGETIPALNRAARLGDGWIGAGTHQPDSIRSYRDQLIEGRKKAGRDHLPFEITVGNSSAGSRTTLDMVKAAQDAGADRMVLRPEWPVEGKLSVQYVHEFMERTADSIIAKLS